MNPENQNTPNQQPQPYQPPAPQPTIIQPQVTSAADQQPPAILGTPAPASPQPQPQVQQPFVQNVQASSVYNPIQETRKAFKNVRRTGITGIVLGILGLIAVGSFAAQGREELLSNAPFFIALLGLAVALLKSQNVAKVLTLLKIMSVLIIIQLVLALIAGGGSGILLIILILFIVKSLKDLKDAGLITSGAILKAKPVENGASLSANAHRGLALGIVVIFAIIASSSAIAYVTSKPDSARVNSTSGVLNTEDATSSLGEDVTKTEEPKVAPDKPVEIAINKSFADELGYTTTVTKIIRNYPSNSEFTREDLAKENRELILVEYKIENKSSKVTGGSPTPLRLEIKSTEGEADRSYDSGNEELAAAGYTPLASESPALGQSKSGVVLYEVPKSDTGLSLYYRLKVNVIGGNDVDKEYTLPLL